MNKTTQITFVVILVILALITLAAVLYFAFVFPKTVATWAEQDRALSAGQQLVANTSAFCKSYGLVLLPLLLAIAVAPVIWIVVTYKYGTRFSRI